MAIWNPPTKKQVTVLFSLDSLVEDETTYFLQAAIVRPHSNNHCHKPTTPDVMFSRSLFLGGMHCITTKKEQVNAVFFPS
jgi:hypothetical protein